MMFSRRACVALALLLASACALVSATPVQPSTGVHSHFDAVPDVASMRVALDDSLAISVEPSVLTSLSSYINVSWTGNEAPQPNDWIAAYSPPPADAAGFLTTLPVKYYNLSDLGSLPGASGSIRMWLLHMRAPWVLAYMRGGFAAPTLLAVSSPVTYAPQLANVPMQIHLARTTDPSEMRVTWVTTNAPQPTIEWSVTPGYSIQVPANTSTYTRDQMCGGLASGLGWRDPGSIHSGVITGLLPGDEISYRVGDPSTQLWSPMMSFFTAPKPGQDISFLIFGDHGQAEFDGTVEYETWAKIDGAMQDDRDQPAAINTTIALANDLADGSVERETAIVLVIGDVSYARGRGEMWDQHGFLIQKFASQVAMMTLLGNHEFDSNISQALFQGGDSGGECGVPVQMRFPMPSPTLSPPVPAPAQGFSATPFYSFDHGSVHFVMMSTEHSFAPGSVQYNWIEADLAAVDRTVTPWIVFSGHRPMYVSSSNSGTPSGDMDVAAQLREQLEPLLLRYRVDVFFAGHHHSYQRSCAVANETCASADAAATKHLLGSVGADEATAANGPADVPTFGIVHTVTGAAGMWCNVFLDPTPLEWLDFANTAVHGYTRARASGHTLTLDFVASSDRSIWDSVTLTQQPNAAPLITRNPSMSYQRTLHEANLRAARVQEA